MILGLAVNKIKETDPNAEVLIQAKFTVWFPKIKTKVKKEKKKKRIRTSVTGHLNLEDNALQTTNRRPVHISSVQRALFYYFYFSYILSTSTSFHIFNVKMHTDHYIYKNQLAL